MASIRSLVCVVACLAVGCGTPTLKEEFHHDMLIEERSVSAHQAKIVLARPGCTNSKTELAFYADGELEACVNALNVGQTVELIVRRIQHPLMSHGKAPEVFHTLGTCKLPRDAIKVLSFVDCAPPAAH